MNTFKLVATARAQTAAANTALAVFAFCGIYLTFLYGHQTLRYLTGATVST